MANVVGLSEESSGGAAPVNGLTISSSTTSLLLLDSTSDSEKLARLSVMMNAFRIRIVEIASDGKQASTLYLSRVIQTVIKNAIKNVLRCS
jgi:hypothetical protein